MTQTFSVFSPQKVLGVISPQSIHAERKCKFEYYQEIIFLYKDNYAWERKNRNPQMQEHEYKRAVA